MKPKKTLYFKAFIEGSFYTVKGKHITYDSLLHSNTSVTNIDLEWLKKNREPISARKAAVYRKNLIK